MPSGPSDAGNIQRRLPAPWVLGAGAFVILLGLIATLGSLGGPHDLRLGLSTVVYMLLRAGTPVAVYLLGAIGLGRMCLPLCRGVANPGDRAALQTALGLGLMLWMGHALGAVGVLRGTTGSLIAGGVCIAGLVLLALQIAAAMRDPAGRATVSPWVLLGLPAVALLLVAAANTPGWLWDSEAGGYDALSYHLQLPQEWLALGRIRPLEHNVYSYLPGYVESAFYTIAVMTGEPAAPTQASRAVGLVAGEGLGVISCQMLSAGIALIAAWMTGQLAARVCRGLGCGGAGIAGAIAAVFVLSTPWTLVVGSLAYNDLGVVLFLSAGLLAAVEDGLSAGRRGLVCGLMIGVACGCKPTALFMAGVPAAVVLLGMLPRKGWMVAVGAGAAGGLAVVAPWLIRNWCYGGNPVFPMATSIFGSAHWSAEQVARYHAAHLVEGGLPQRVLALVWPDAGARTIGGTHMRGILHPQWFAFAPVCVLGSVGAMRWCGARRVALLLIGGIVMQVLCWMFLTHLQSRFLLPVMVPGCVLIGLGVAWGQGGRKTSHAILATGFGAVACLIQAAAAIMIFAGQRGGQPNALLTLGPSWRTGEAMRPEFEAAAPADRVKVLGGVGPEAFINYWAAPGAPVYLLGDATPLYFRSPVLYNTTWDHWPLGDAMRAFPSAQDAPKWTAALRSRGVRLVLINFAELGRLSRSGGNTGASPGAAKPSGWSDPMITPDSVRDWIANGGLRPIKDWPDLGTALFELVETR